MFGYVLWGVIGGGAYCIVTKLGWGEKAEILRRLALGGIAGALTFMLGLPNHVTSFGLGYFATDTIEAIAARVKMKKDED